jgi:hypothetical protein
VRGAPALRRPLEPVPELVGLHVVGLGAPHAALAPIRLREVGLAYAARTQTASGRYSVNGRQSRRYRSPAP